MYNSSTKKLKAVLVAILAIVLLVNAVLPMTVMGSSRENTGDYQYYVIKSGDTLTRIAKTHGVTVSDIMTANNLSDADRIISGKVIKIPLTEESSASTWSSSRLSLNLVDANVKDALSAIARNAGYTIILSVTQPQRLPLILSRCQHSRLLTMLQGLRVFLTLKTATP